MTVKPPGGPTAPPPAVPEPKTGGPSGAESFQAALESSEAPARATEIASEIAQKVREGGMTVAQAVEALVDRTLADPAFSKLSAERLDALRTELRELIASDPTLASLSQQIAR